MKEYWFCKIGPIERRLVPFGGDWPLRQSVQETFEIMFPEKEYICSSGWGLTEEMNTRLDIISFLPITDPSMLLKIDKLLEKRNKL